MIKYLLITSLLILCIHEVKAQIPNGGFEMWDNISNHEKPALWWTNQDTIYTRIKKDTVSIEGNYSLNLVPSVTNSWQGCESIAAIRFNFDSVLPDNSVLSFYVKSVPQDIAEDSSVYLFIFGFTFNSDSVIGGFDWRAETPIFEFERVEIPLSGENIDEMTIFIYGGAGSNPVDGPCLARSNSWVDGMTIDFKIPVGSFISKEKNDIIIYPNPSTGVVNIIAHDEGNIGYELYSLIGELIAKGKIDNNQLNIYDPGMYILKLYTGLDDRKIYSSKLIIIN